MDMASIKLTRVFFCFNIQRLFFVICLLFPWSAYAFNWTVNPTLNLEQTYSDNINQAQGNEKSSALVTELSPGISIQGRSSRSRLDLNYRMQTLYNAGGSSGVDINNQLTYTSHYELFKDRFFIDSSSSISQQNNSNRDLATDNLTNSSNDSTISTFSFSPSWTPHFKNYLDAVVSFDYHRVSTLEGESALSDSNSFNQNITLTSGRAFGRFSWSANFNNRQESREGGEDVKFQSSSFSLSTFLFNRKFNAFVNLGHSENDFNSNSQSNQNGFFYTFGASWRPSERFSVEAGYGNNIFVTVNVMPIRRINWSLTYRNNDIGTNVGDTWESTLDYYTRHSKWRFTYAEDTVSTQELIRLTGQELVRRIIFQDININNIFFDRFGNITELTDEVFITKTANLSYSYSKGKSEFSVNGFYIDRDFEESLEDEKVYGFSGSWNWTYSQRTSTRLGASWQTTDRQDNIQDDRFDLSLRLSRNISRYVDANINYRFITELSDDPSDEFTENRVTAGLSMRF